MLKKITIIIILLFSLLTSLPANAATAGANSQIPELNPFCWHRKDCQTIRKQFGGTGVGDEGFITAGVAPCTGGTGDDQWGRCLPAGQSKTEISFGGQSKFSNIGDFILLMYKYLITIASIVAVVVIVIAGAQWVTSGGNSEAISSAKHRIGGAIIGLFIAYMSYFVLNTINPALVNLRLPQVWLVKPQTLIPEFCTDIPGATTTIKFALVATKEEPNKPLPAQSQRNYVSTPNEALFSCGSRFLAENGGEVVCRGSYCGNQQACFDKVGDGKAFECGDVRIGGTITYTALVKRCNILSAAADFVADVASPWNCPPITDSWLVALCNKDGTSGAGGRVVNGHGEKKDRYYEEATIAELNSAEQDCASHGGLKGFALEFAMDRYGVTANDSGEHHYIGKGGVDLGADAATQIVSDISIPVFFKIGIADKVSANSLFSKEELIKGVHLNIEAGNIPRLGFDALNQ